MKPQLLTIAIPTYNRPEQLQNTLRVILPQVVSDERVRLLVLDNHSATPAQKIYSALDIEAASERVEIIRNKVNIGANANIMRCFEMCETSWLWVLGDDDKPATDAVGLILKDIDNSLSYIYYSVPAIQKPLFTVEESDSVIGAGFEALVNRFGGAIDQLAFLSAAVFNMDVIRPYIIDGYLVVNTGVPHLAMLLKTLMEENKKWLISQKSIVDYQMPDSSHRWGVLYIAYAMPALFSIATSSREVSLIRECIVQKWRFKPKKLLSSMITLHHAEFDPRLLQYLYRVMSAFYRPSPFKNLAVWCRWKIMPFWMMFLRGFISHYIAKSKKRRKSGVNQDRR
jgi:abequosyltransferase